MVTPKDTTRSLATIKDVGGIPTSPSEKMKELFLSFLGFVFRSFTPTISSIDSLCTETLVPLVSLIERITKQLLSKPLKYSKKSSLTITPNDNISKTYRNLESEEEGFRMVLLVNFLGGRIGFRWFRSSDKP